MGMSEQCMENNHSINEYNIEGLHTYTKENI